MEMRWRSSRPGRAARQIACRCPTPQPGQRSLTITAAGGTAGDEANEAVSPNATMSETETASTEIPIGDGGVDLDPTREDTSPGPPGDWSLSVDPPLALGGGDSPLGPATVRPRPPIGIGTTPTGHNDLGGPKVHTAESGPTPWVFGE